MQENVNSLEDFYSLIDKVAHLMDDLTSSNLIDVEFIRSANRLLKQIAETKFDIFNSPEVKFASALFKTPIRTQLLNRNDFFQAQVEAEIVQNANTLREILRQAALKLVVDSSIPNELRLRLESKAYTLKSVLQDFWERCQSDEYQGEPRPFLQKELS